MKYIKRFFCVFLVCVFLFSVFSVPVSAEESATEFSFWDSEVWLATTSSSNKIIDTWSYSTNTSNTVGGYSPEYTNLSTNNHFLTVLTILHNNQNVIFQKNETYKIRTSGTKLYLRPKNAKLEDYKYLSGSSGGLNPNTNCVNIQFRYSDNTTSSYIPLDLTVFSANKLNNSFSYIFDITPDKDVTHVYIRSYHKFSDFGYTSSTYSGDIYLNNMDFESSYQKSTEEAGLLKGITGWIQNIFNSILELPQKIGNFILDGLKSLFVPDEQFMVSYKDKWDNLLSSRFGAIYQVGTIIFDSFSTLEESDKTNTVSLPDVSLAAVGIPFNFGGYDVQVVPSGFDIVIEILKKIISIACTFLFINGLRKRYDEIMGVQQ